MIQGAKHSFGRAIWLVLMVSTWALFAPTQFGGNASYVIVAGASMEPTLHKGDLVIAREAETYQIGDITTYLHPSVGPVIHRIIERQGQQYVLKGDNNDWIDTYTPSADEILGRAWLSIPRAAEALLWLRSPIGLAILSLVIGILAIITLRQSDSEVEDELNMMKSSRSILNKWVHQIQALSLGDWVFPLAVVLFASMLLGIFAFTRPLDQTVSADIAYTHASSFTYEGSGSISIYDRGKIRTGDAIFHGIVSEFDLTYSYALNTHAETDLIGTYRILLRLSEPNGWQREFLVHRPDVFEGPTFDVSTSIQLDPVLAAIDVLNDRTGLNRRTFDIDFIVPVFITGTIGGIEFSDTHFAQYSMKLDDFELFPENQNPIGSGDVSQTPGETEFIPKTAVIPNTVSILGIELGVQQARDIALYGGSISLLLLSILLLPTYLVTARSEIDWIKINHKDLLLEVREFPEDMDTVWLEFYRFEDLLKLSRSTGNLIYFRIDDDKHTFVVPDGVINYMYSIEEAGIKSQAVSETEQEGIDEA